MQSLDSLLYKLGKAGDQTPASRLCAELGFARRVSLVENGAYDELLSQAAHRALAANAAQGALTLNDVYSIEELLAPMADACKRYTWLLIGHAHIDMNWLWPYEETVAIVLDTLSTMLRLMKEHPLFTFAQSQASVYKIVEEYAPEMLPEIRLMIKEGRWEVTASSWVESDRNMPSLESEIRHLLYTKRYLSSLLDISEDELNLDYMPDTFGHNAFLPDVLNKGGVRYMYHCRGEKTESLYRWHGAGGGELLVYSDPVWYNIPIKPELALGIPEFCAQYEIPAVLTVYGVGDHGGGPTNTDLCAIEEMAKWPIFPSIRFGTYREFFAACEQSAVLPVVQGERNCVFTGCYTSQSRIKTANAQAERTLYSADLFKTFAYHAVGDTDRRAQLKKAWLGKLFNDFHDILPGSGVRETRDYAMGKYSEVFAEAMACRRSAYGAIARRIDTSTYLEAGRQSGNAVGAGAGMSAAGGRISVASTEAGDTRIFHIFNDLPFARKENAELVLWDYPYPAERMAFFGVDGEPLVFQFLEQGSWWCGLNHYVKGLVRVKLPSAGYTTVLLRAAEAQCEPVSRVSVDMRCDEASAMTLENNIVRAEFDVRTARLRRFIDKRSGKCVLDGAGFDFITEEWEGMSAWRIGRHMNVVPLGAQTHIRKTMSGDLRNAFEVKTAFSSSTLTYTVSLDAGSASLRYDVNLDWRETANDGKSVPLLAFRSELCEAPDDFVYLVPGGEITRKPDNQDKPSLGAVAGGGAALIAGGRYGFRGYESTMSVSLVRSSGFPDPVPETGEIHCQLSLGVPALSLRAEADRFTHSPEAITGEAHQGSLGAEHSFLAIEGGAELSGIKLSEDDDALLLHLSHNQGGDGNVALRFDRVVMEAYVTDYTERRRGESLAVSGNTVHLPMKAQDFASVKVYLAD